MTIEVIFIIRTNINRNMFFFLFNNITLFSIGNLRDIVQVDHDMLIKGKCWKIHRKIVEIIGLLMELASMQ